MLFGCFTIVNTDCHTEKSTRDTDKYYKKKCEWDIVALKHWEKKATETTEVRRNAHIQSVWWEFEPKVKRLGVESSSRCWLLSLTSRTDRRILVAPTRLVPPLGLSWPGCEPRTSPNRPGQVGVGPESERSPVEARVCRGVDLSPRRDTCCVSAAVESVAIIANCELWTGELCPLQSAPATKCLLNCSELWTVVNCRSRSWSHGPKAPSARI